MYTNTHLSSTQAHTYPRLNMLLYPWVCATLSGSISPEWTIYPPHLLLNPIPVQTAFRVFLPCRPITSSFSGAATSTTYKCTQISSVEYNWIIHVQDNLRVFNMGRQKNVRLCTTTMERTLTEMSPYKQCPFAILLTCRINYTRNQPEINDVGQ